MYGITHNLQLQYEIRKTLARVRRIRLDFQKQAYHQYTRTHPFIHSLTRAVYMCIRMMLLVMVEKRFVCNNIVAIVWVRVWITAISENTIFILAQ